MPTALDNLSSTTQSSLSINMKYLLQDMNAAVDRAERVAVVKAHLDQLYAITVFNCSTSDLETISIHLTVLMTKLPKKPISAVTKAKALGRVISERNSSPDLKEKKVVTKTAGTRLSSPAVRSSTESLGQHLPPLCEDKGEEVKDSAKQSVRQRQSLSPYIRKTKPCDSTKSRNDTSQVPRSVPILRSKRSCLPTAYQDLRSRYQHSNADTEGSTSGDSDDGVSCSASSAPDPSFMDSILKTLEDEAESYEIVECTIGHVVRGVKTLSSRTCRTDYSSSSTEYSRYT